MSLENIFRSIYISLRLCILIMWFLLNESILFQLHFQEFKFAGTEKSLSRENMFEGSKTNGEKFPEELPQIKEYHSVLSRRETQEANYLGLDIELNCLYPCIFN